MSVKIIISFDFELGWGVLENGGWLDLEKRGVYSKMREDIPRILSALETAEIPTTWAVVAGMLAPGVHEISLSHLPGDYKDSVESFISRADEQTKNGMDLFEQISDMGDLCEMASHTTTHIYADHPAVCEEHYIQDVKQSFLILDEYTSSPVNTFVFPRDEANHRLPISKLRRGLNMRLNPMVGKRLGPFRRACGFVFDFARSIPESQTYIGSNSEVYQFGSLYFNMCGNKYRRLRGELLKTRMNRFLRQIEAQRLNGVFHLWLHPFNLSESDTNLRLFHNLINRLGELQKNGHVQLITMKELAR